MATRMRALISLSLLACCNAQAFPSFGGIWGGDDEAEKAPSRYESEPASVVIDASGSAEENDAQVEQVVEQLSNQLRSTIKSQIKQIQSGNGVGGESRLGMSKFSSLTELHIAVANNQYEVAERLLANGADVDARSPAQMTPLHSAADGGYKDIANLLLAHNATIDALGPHGATPLHLAAHRGRSSTVELLLREGAPMDVITDESFSFTPLYMACDMGHTRVVQVLLAANASTEIRAHNGGTALHAAVVGGHEGVVRALLDAGADIDARDNEGLRPYIYAKGMPGASRAAIIPMLEEGGAEPISAEEEEAMKGRTFVRAEIKPFMRMA